MKEIFVVKKVLIRTDGVKYVVIPKESEINSGEYVIINKIKTGGKND